MSGIHHCFARGESLSVLDQGGDTLGEQGTLKRRECGFGVCLPDSNPVT